MGKRISQQSETDALHGDELFPFARNGGNAVATADTIKEYAQDGLDNKYATIVRVNDLLDGFAPKSWLASTDQEVARINNALMSGLSYKVDKEEGKGLSSNDFTDEDKAKLDRFELVLANDDEIEAGLAQIASSEDYRTELKKNGYVVYHNVKFKVKDCGVTSNSIPWITTEGAVITDNDEGELFDHTQGNFLRSVAIWFDGYLVYQPYDTAVNSEAIYIDEISIDDIDNALNSNAIKSLELTDEKANSLTLKLKKATSQGVSVYLKRETEGGDDKLQLTNIQSTSVNGNTAFIAGVMMVNTLNDDNATYSKICHILIADNAVLIYPEFVPSRAELNNKVDKVEGKVLSSNDYTDADKNKLDGIEDGAQVNTVTSVNGRTGAVTGLAEATDVPTKVSELANDSNYQTQSQVDDRFQQLVGAAPADLDTLEELAERLQDGDDIHTALIQSISEKVTKPTNGTSSQFLKADGSVDGTAYLPLSGGTLTGQFKISSHAWGQQLIIDRTYGPPSIFFQKNGEDIGYIYPLDNDLIFGETNSGNRKIWDSGNDGSGSGLDADLLDGVHNGNLTASKLTYKGFSNASEIDFSSVAWSADGACSDISTFGYKSVLTIGNDMSRGWQIFSGRGDNHIYYRNAKDDKTGWNGEIKTVAFTTDNVASADKLTTKQLTNEDLNTIKNGNLFVYYGFGNNTCTNKPIGIGGFYLQVFGQDINGCVQILSAQDGVIYRRAFINNTWLPWKKMLTEDDITSLAARVTALENK